MSKAQARAAAKIRRAEAHRLMGDTPDLTRHLRAALAPFAQRRIALYMPIGTEIDPLPAALGLPNLCLPVVVAKGQALLFRAWAPGEPLIEGAFGAAVPAPEAQEVVPEVIVVPLLAFARDGRRLGYGGGFYDRTLSALQARAIGFAYAAQEDAELPIEPTDHPLDLIVTERGVILP